MSRFPTALVAVSFLLTSAAGLSAQKAVALHAPDSRAPQYIAPLYFSPKPNAPFMAIANTEWVRALPDGSTVTTKNSRVVARDMEGRIFQERRTFVPVPDNGRRESRAYAAEYTDPVEHTVNRCNTDLKLCNLFPFGGPLMDAAVPAGLQPDGTTFLTREDLGVDTFAGQEVHRSRETLTLNALSVGNTRTILRTTEFWYSPALGVNLQVKRHDPRDGDQTLWLSDISFTPAAPETFKVPAGYRIVDHRGAGPALTRAGTER